MIKTIIFLLLTLSAYAQVKSPLVIAHRGASGVAPENTLSAISKALELGVDVIEIDVHQTADSQIVVMHDESVNRTTNHKGKIKDFTLAQLKQMDAGSWLSKEFEGVKIPLLSEALILINGKVKLLIELKRGSNYYPGIEQRVVNEIKKSNASEWCLIHTFDQTALFNLQSFENNIPLSKLIVFRIDLLKVYCDKVFHTGSINRFNNCFGINYYYRFVTKRFVRKMHQKNLQVFVWTVNSQHAMKRCLKRGVDGIITNHPEKLSKLITKNNLNKE